MNDDKVELPHYFDQLPIQRKRYELKRKAKYLRIKYTRECKELDPRVVSNLVTMYEELPFLIRGIFPNSKLESIKRLDDIESTAEGLISLSKAHYDAIMQRNMRTVNMARSLSPEQNKKYVGALVLAQSKNNILNYQFWNNFPTFGNPKCPHSYRA
jgi:hypothetical protein